MSHRAKSWKLRTGWMWRAVVRAGPAPVPSVLWSLWSSMQRSTKNCRSHVLVSGKQKLELRRAVRSKFIMVYESKKPCRKWGRRWSWGMWRRWRMMWTHMWESVLLRLSWLLVPKCWHCLQLRRLCSWCSKGFPWRRWWHAKKQLRLVGPCRRSRSRVALQSSWWRSPRRSGSWWRSPRWDGISAWLLHCNWVRYISWPIQCSDLGHRASAALVEEGQWSGCEPLLRRPYSCPLVIGVGGEGFLVSLGGCVFSGYYIFPVSLVRKRSLNQKMMERHVVERGDASIYFTLDICCLLLCMVFDDSLWK